MREDVVEELKRWSSSVLEKTNENYNGLPACPFARRAWAEDKVGFLFKETDEWDSLYLAIEDWDDSKEVVILVDHCYPELDDMYAFLDDMNKDIADGVFATKDMFLMGFHPDAEDNDLLDDKIEMTDEEPYAMIFLQRLSKLQEASDQLREKGYYNTCEDYYNGSSLYQQRQDYYRRLKCQVQ